MSTMWIISGPSSAGKSVFIRSPHGRDITGLPASAPAFHRAKLLRGMRGSPGDCLLHPGLVRPVRTRPWELRWWMLYVARMLIGADRHGAGNGSGIGEFLRRTSWNSLAWRTVLSHPSRKKAVVLVTSRDTLQRRVAERSGRVERRFFDTINKRYLGQRWLDTYARVDLAQTYADWLAELRRRGIPYVLVNSTSPDYALIDDEARIPDIIHSRGN